MSVIMFAKLRRLLFTSKVSNNGTLLENDHFSEFQHHSARSTESRRRWTVSGRALCPHSPVLCAYFVPTSHKKWIIVSFFLTCCFLSNLRCDIGDETHLQRIQLNTRTYPHLQACQSSLAFSTRDIASSLKPACWPGPAHQDYIRPVCLL